MVIRRASAKLQDGDVSGAAKCLGSEETLAILDSHTLSIMESKHPSAHPERRPPPPSLNTPLQISSGDILSVIRSFPPGSAAGRYSLRPQHLKDMTDGGGSMFCDSLAKFDNLVLRGGVPSEIQPFFFGASLFLFKKKSAGLRPVAVGLVLRRLY